MQQTQELITQAEARVALAEANLSNEIQTTVADAQRYTLGAIERFQQAQASGRRYAGGFDNGGMISDDEFGIVGERGPEIVSGRANVTGRMKTFDVMNKISERMKAVANAQENQVNSVDKTSQISNNNNELNAMIKNLNDSINNLNAGIHNVASINQQQLDTGIKNLRATKGLQGNVLKGVAR
jgi:hypothetical protein